MESNEKINNILTFPSDFFNNDDSNNININEINENNFNNLFKKVLFLKEYNFYLQPRLSDNQCSNWCVLTCVLNLSIIIKNYDIKKVIELFKNITSLSKFYSTRINSKDEKPENVEKIDKISLTTIFRVEKLQDMLNLSKIRSQNCNISDIIKNKKFPDYKFAVFTVAHRHECLVIKHTDGKYYVFNPGLTFDQFDKIQNFEFKTEFTTTSLKYTYNKNKPKEITNFIIVE